MIPMDQRSASPIFGLSDAAAFPNNSVRNPFPQAPFSPSIGFDNIALLVFNLLPTRGRHFLRIGVLCPAGISIHAPAWGRLLRRGLACRQPHFNPRPRVGGDWLQGRSAQGAGHFNPRPRVGGDGILQNPAQPRGHFNPRPRVGGDRERVGCTGADYISIHAPAWGATPTKGVCLYCGTIFQSTPPRGGRHDDLVQLWRGTPISIHAPAWGATCGTASPTGFRPISIHAPTRGATAETAATGVSVIFQSTPPRGGRPPFAHHMRPSALFQSTPPRGGRPKSRLHPRYTAYFNPRPRVGGDEMTAKYYAIAAISIHAPAWGATHV